MLRGLCAEFVPLYKVMLHWHSIGRGGTGQCPIQEAAKAKRKRVSAQPQETCTEMGWPGEAQAQQGAAKKTAPTLKNCDHGNLSGFFRSAHLRTRRHHRA